MKKPKIQQLATATNDITRQYVGPLLQAQDRVLIDQGGGDYSIYEELLIDTQVFSCFGQYCDRIIKCEVVVEPASDDEQDVAIADFVRENIEGLNFDEITRAMLYARIFGYSIGEIIWEYKEGRNRIKDIKVRSQRRFKFDENYGLRLLTYTNGFEGEVMPDKKFWTLTMGGHVTDNPYGLGVGHQLYWPVLIKRMGMKSWLKFLDKFAQPFVLVRHSDSASEGEIEKALELADSFSEDSSGAASELLQVELIESKRTGGASYSEICDKMDAAIAKVLLSQTMTTDNGSSRSQAEVHDGVAGSAIKAAADLLCSSFNSGPIAWLVEYNFGPDAKLPRVWRKTEPDRDLFLQAQVDEKLTAIGYKPSVEHIVATYGEGYRPPEKNDAISPLNGEQVSVLNNIISAAVTSGWSPELAIATIQASFPTVPPELITAIGQHLKEQQAKPKVPLTESFSGDGADVVVDLDVPDNVDAMADRLRTADLARPWLEKLMADLNESGDLVKFSEGLEASFDELDPALFRKAMLEAVSLLSLSGLTDEDTNG